MLPNFFPFEFQIFSGLVYTENAKKKKKKKKRKENANALNGSLFSGNFSVYEILLEYQVILPTHHHK